MLLSAHRKRPETETDRLEAAYANLPARVERHSLMARLFHWVMAASMFVLLFTAFLPVVGVQIAWVTWHWIAGVVLTGSILFHILHASFWLDFWSIWVTSICRVLTTCNRSATTSSSALACCHGSGLLTLRLLFVHRSAVPFLISPTLRKVFTALAQNSCPSRRLRSLCPAFRRLSFG
jgi:Ni,Fe-hydrogenase I cytochrome b subunit